MRWALLFLAAPLLAEPLADVKALNSQVRRSEGREQKRSANEALEAARLAVKKLPQSPEAHAYYAEALGQWANIHKGLGSLKRVKEAVTHLQEALRLNPRYAYAHMLLASFYREAPRGISVGDKKKALFHAQKAVECAPQYAIHHLTLAKVLLDYDRRAEAIHELQTVLALKAPEDAIAETKTDQAAAQKLLEKWHGH